jgi:hypothetical protein
MGFLIDSIVLSEGCSMSPQDAFRVYRQIIRVFSAGLAALMILTELEWEFLLAYMRAMDYWVFRGFLHVRRVPSFGCWIGVNADRE